VHDVTIDNENRKIVDPIKNKMKTVYLKDKPEVFEFFSSCINFDAISTGESLILATMTPDTVKGVLDEDLDLVINMQLINDVSWIQKFLVNVNFKLKWGGYFCGVVEVLDQRFKRKFSKSPKFLKGFLHLVDFMWSRAFSKLPGVYRIYYLIHGQKMRAVSRTEILGRLHFCGFRAVKVQEIGKWLYFVVKKIRAPLWYDVKSWGVLFKQKRVGLNGEWIYVYKFRTMHPYSEYLHKYLYKKKKLDETGKIKDDTRITEWGHVLRKYWLDEIPMLVNFLQGDLKLVGLRPVSKSFFDIYPEDLQKSRIKLKPGLIPSIYYDMPKKPDEIWDSERKYIQKYHKHPFRTDFVYFFKVIYNIVFRGARSG
jgi:lipopolysaccharide/colanic/teichoic acid biosynthesis glycosyltransferase